MPVEVRTDGRYPFDDFYNSRDDPPVLASGTPFEPSSNYEAYERGHQLLRAAETTIAPLLEKLDDFSLSAGRSQSPDYNDRDAVRIRTLVNNAIKELDGIPEDVERDSVNQEVKRKVVPCVPKPSTTASSSSAYSGDPQAGKESGGVLSSLRNQPHKQHQKYSPSSSGSAYKDMSRARKQVAEACDEAQDVAVSLRSLEKKPPRRDVNTYRARIISGEKCRCTPVEDRPVSGHSGHCNTPVTLVSDVGISDVPDEFGNTLPTHRENVRRGRENYELSRIPSDARYGGQKIQNGRPKESKSTGRGLDWSIPKNMEKSNVVRTEASGRHTNTGVFVVKTLKNPPIVEEEEKLKKLVIQDTPLLVIPRECAVQRGYHIDCPPDRTQCSRRNVVVRDVIFDKDSWQRGQRCSVNCDCNIRKDTVKVSGSAPFLFDINNCQCESKSNQRNNLGFYSFLEQKDKPARPQTVDYSEKKTRRNNGGKNQPRRQHDGSQDREDIDGANGYKETFERYEYRKTEREVDAKSPHEYYSSGSNSGRDQPKPEPSVTSGKVSNTFIELNPVTLEEEENVSHLDSSQEFSTSNDVQERAGFDSVPHETMASCTCNSEFANAENNTQSDVQLLFSKLETLEETTNDHTTRVTEILKYLSTELDQKCARNSQHVDQEVRSATSDDADNRNERYEIQRAAPDMRIRDFPDTKWTTTVVRQEIKSMPVQENSKTRSGKRRSPIRHETRKISPGPLEDQNACLCRKEPRRVSPGKQRNRKDSPGKKDHRKASPSKQEYKNVSPGRTEHRKASPSKKEFRKLSPGKQEYRQISPDRQAYRKSSPGKQNYRNVSPGRQAHGKVYPGRPEHSTISPARHAHRKCSPCRQECREVSPGKREHRTISPGKQSHGKVSSGKPEHRTISPARPALRNVSPGRREYGQVSTCTNEQRRTFPLKTPSTQVAKDKQKHVKPTHHLARKKFPSSRTIAKSRSRKLAKQIKRNITSRDVVPVFKVNRRSVRPGTAALPRAVVGKCVYRDCAGFVKDKTPRSNSLSPKSDAKGVRSPRNSSLTSKGQTDISCECPEPILPSPSEKPVPRYQQRILCRPVCHPPVRTTPQGHRVLSCKPNCTLNNKLAPKVHKKSVQPRPEVKKSKRPGKSRSPGRAATQKTDDQDENCDCLTLPEDSTKNELEEDVKIDDQDENCDCLTLPEDSTKKNEPHVTTCTNITCTGNCISTPDTYRKIYTTSRDPSPAASVQSGDENVKNIISDEHPASRELKVYDLQRNKDVGVQCHCHPLSNDSPIDVNPKSQPITINTSVQCQILKDSREERYSRSTADKKDMAIQCDCLPESQTPSPVSVPKSSRIEKRITKCAVDYLPNSKNTLKKVPVPVPAPRRQNVNESIKCLCRRDVLQPQANISFRPRGEAVPEAPANMRSELSMCASQLASILSDLTYKNQLLNKEIEKVKESEERQREAGMRASLETISCDCTEGEDEPVEDIFRIVETPCATKNPTIIMPSTSREDKDRREVKIINVPEKLPTRRMDTTMDDIIAGSSRNMSAGKSTTVDTEKIYRGRATETRSEKLILEGTPTNLKATSELVKNSAASLASRGSSSSSNSGDPGSTILIGPPRTGDSRTNEEIRNNNLNCTSRNECIGKPDTDYSIRQFEEDVKADEEICVARRGGAAILQERIPIRTEVERFPLVYDDDSAVCGRDDCACQDSSSDDIYAVVQASTSEDTLSTWSEGEIRSLGEIRLRQGDTCYCPEAGVRSVGEITDYDQGNNLSDYGCRSSGEIVSTETSSEDACECKVLSAGEVPCYTSGFEWYRSKQMPSGSSSSGGNIDIDLQIQST